MKTLSILFISVLFINSSVIAKNPIDFTLASATDTSHFTLSKTNEKFVALHFLLKTECPYCMRHTHEYFLKAKSLPNVLQVFIKPDTETEIKEWTSKLDVGEVVNYQIFRDPDALLAKSFDIKDGYKFHGQTVHYPALILLDTNGHEVFRYIGKDNSDRFSFEQLTLKIKEITEKTK